MRRSFKVKRFWCHRKSKLATIRGEDSIDKELDIVNFVRKQKYLTIMLKALFSREERFCITKNHKFTLNTKRVLDPSSSELEKDPDNSKLSHETPMLRKLLLQAFNNGLKKTLKALKGTSHSIHISQIKPKA